MQHRVLHMHGGFPNRKLKRVFCDSIRSESIEYRIQSIALDDRSFLKNLGSADSIDTMLRTSFLNFLIFHTFPPLPCNRCLGTWVLWYMGTRVLGHLDT